MQPLCYKTLHKAPHLPKVSQRQQMPAHAVGCISKVEHCAWRIHPFSIEWYQACCLERDITSSLKLAHCRHNPVKGTRQRESRALQCWQNRKTVHSGFMWIASPNRYLGYMEYFNYNMLNLSIFFFDLCFMVFFIFFDNSFTSMLE